MTDEIHAGLVFVLLGAASAAGFGLYRYLPALHRSRETLDFTRLVTGLLVTFVSLVLGLLISSVNAGFDKTSNDLQAFAADVIRLSASLEEYGPATLPARADLRRYLASAVASTWPEQPAPGGDYPVAATAEDDFDASNLSALLRRIDGQILALPASDPVQAGLRAACLGRIDQVESRRWTLIGEAHHSISAPFLAVTLLWLVVIFLSFGLSAPRNLLSVTSIALVALCVSGAFFVMLELDGPLDGVIKVSSEPLRHALRHLDASLGRPQN